MSKAELEKQVKLMDAILENYEGRISTLEVLNADLTRRVEDLSIDVEELRVVNQKTTTTKRAW